MQTLLFILAWIAVAVVVAAAAFYSTRNRGRGATAKPLGRVSSGLRMLLGAVVLAAIVGMPIVVFTSASDRVPSGAGTYTLNSSKSLRDGRMIFRQTCSSCHTLSAAGARGVYGFNLDTVGLNVEGSASRVEAAIKNGGATGLQMPKNLLEGKDAKLVSAYVAAVAGK
ncbi:MAG: cytochrome c [Thermoleophilia bacterium]|nr:cytochrome c [Thermoleophilia bacterium]